MKQQPDNKKMLSWIALLLICTPLFICFQKAISTSILCFVITLNLFVFFLACKIYTQSKLTIKNYNELIERYTITTTLTNDVVFEYDLKREKILHHITKESNFMIQTSALECFTNPNAFSNDQSSCFVYDELNSGKPTISVEVKLPDLQNQFIWCRIKGKTIYDSQGNPQKVVGKIMNIDIEKKSLEELKEKANRDSLTGLYNKTVTQNLIDEIIQQQKTTNIHAFMIIDIDNFKKVNDYFGHLTGDEVLLNVTTQLQALFCKQDILGRIGGDEFVVFMPNVASIKEVFLKANALSRVLRCHYSKENKECSVSGSIGISICPYDGLKYTELLKNADEALYKIKNDGKNNFSTASLPEKYCF